MGCDIHLHTEVKIHDKWHHHGAPHIPRYYSLFAKIANVRNHDRGVHIAYPLKYHEGLPPDLTELTQIYFNWDNDQYTHGVHHVGWLDQAHINELWKWYEEGHDKSENLHGFEGVFDYLFQNAWFDAASHYKTGVTDVRFIFWFDH